MLAATIASLFNPLINIYLFMFVLTSTWIVDIICLRRINNHMKRIGAVLPNKSTVVLTQINVFL